MNSTSNLTSRLIELDRKIIEHFVQHPVKAALIALISIVAGIILAVGVAGLCHACSRRFSATRQPNPTQPTLTNNPYLPTPPSALTPQLPPTPALSTRHPLDPIPRPADLDRLLRPLPTTTSTTPTPPASTAPTQPPRDPSPLDPMWENREIIPLIQALESQLDQPEGITWIPPHPLRTAPPLPTPMPYLSAYATDLTEKAARGEFEPFVGRERDFQNIAEIFGRSRQNTPIIIGAKGIGKTKIGEGLAQRIVDDDPTLPAMFRGKRVFLLQRDKLSRGASNYSSDSVEKRMTAILNEVKNNKDSVIIFMDEFENLQKYDLNIMNIIKPDLDDGTFPCIAATTAWDYNSMLLLDRSLDKWFSQVNISEPTQEEVRSILTPLTLELEIHHGVRFEPTAIEETISLADRYFKSLSFPAKAIDLLDRGASAIRARAQRNGQTEKLIRFLKLLLYFKTQLSDSATRTHIDDKITEYRNRLTDVVSSDTIRAIVADKINIPLQRIQEDERMLLNTLEEKLEEKIIAQEEAIRVLSQAIRRGRVGIGDPNKPQGVFFFLGPTGVGKTEIVRALTELLFGSKDLMLRLDMSEYKNAADINKLIGSPTGYLGSTQGGKLTNWLRKNPYSIVLFDELEKADPAVFDLLLQVLDAGRLTDGLSQTVQCRDTIFVMTSNLGADLMLSASDKAPEVLESEMNALLKEKFKPEFLGRIQETVYFKPLSKQSVKEIAELQCGELKTSMRTNTRYPGLDIIWNEAFINRIVEIAYAPDKGARELENCIRRYMVQPISDELTNQTIPPGSIFSFNYDGRRIQMNILAPGSQPEPSSSSGPSAGPSQPAIDNGSTSANPASFPNELPDDLS